MKMNLLQHYYTASRKVGDYGTLGKSNEISKDDENELLKYIDYSPPSSLPYKPDNSQMNLYPTSYSYFILKSGHRCYTKATYTGRGNHTPNRWDNFFSHTVIPIKNIEIPTYELFRKMDFIGGMSPEEDEKVPDNLESVEIDLNDSPSVYFEELCDFFNQSNRISIFERLLNTLTATFQQGTKKILILDNKDNLDKWFFGVHFFLPYCVAEKITFSSYKKVSENPKFDLLGVVPESEYIHTDEEPFYFLDVLNSSIIHQGFVSTRYAKEVCEIIKDKQYTKLISLYEIVNKLRLKNIKDLDIAIIHQLQMTNPEKFKTEELLKTAKSLSGANETEFLTAISDKCPIVVHKLAMEKLNQNLNSASFYHIFDSYYHYINESKEIKSYTDEYIDSFIRKTPEHQRSSAAINILQKLNEWKRPNDLISKNKVTELCELARQSEYENIYDSIFNAEDIFGIQFNQYLTKKIGKKEFFIRIDTKIKNKTANTEINALIKQFEPLIDRTSKTEEAITKENAEIMYAILTKYKGYLDSDYIEKYIKIFFNIDSSYLDLVDYQEMAYDILNTFLPKNISEENISKIITVLDNSIKVPYSVEFKEKAISIYKIAKEYNIEARNATICFKFNNIKEIQADKDYLLFLFHAIDKEYNVEESIFLRLNYRKINSNKRYQQEYKQAVLTEFFSSYRDINQSWLIFLNSFRECYVDESEQISIFKHVLMNIDYVKSNTNPEDIISFLGKSNTNLIGLFSQLFSIEEDKEKKKNIVNDKGTNLTEITQNIETKKPNIFRMFISAIQNLFNENEQKPSSAEKKGNKPQKRVNKKSNTIKNK